MDGAPSAPLSGSLTQQAYCAPDKMTAFSRLFRFGMTFKPLTADRGEELLTLYLEGFHVKTSVPQEKAQELMENDQECGQKWLASFVKYDHDTSLWRTHQCSLLGDLEEFSETWPQWGLMRDGECWEQLTLERLTRGTEFGLPQNAWTTPTSRDWKGTTISKNHPNGFNQNLANDVIKWPTPVHSEARQGLQIRRDGKKGTQTSLSTAVLTWPTPRTKGMCGGSGSWDLLNKNTTLEEARQMGAGNGGQLNPTWVEWLMGWPLGWTDLKPLEMDKCLYAPQPHGEYSQKDN